MSVLPVGFGGAKGYQIANSLRFRASASAYLNRTAGAPTSQRIGTLSLWFKRGLMGVALQPILAADKGSSHDQIGFDSNDTLTFITTGGTTQAWTAAVFRDPTAWCHLVIAWDTTQATAANRVKFYLNGVELAHAGGATYPALNRDMSFSASGIVQYLMRRSGAATYNDGYAADTHFIDGQALTPTSFGQTNAEGVWVPKKYTGTYGANGFYLKFDDGSSATTLCYDRSGNGNNWTPNNISTTAGVTYDWMVDTPTNNYATLNSVAMASNHTTSEASLKVSNTNAVANGHIKSTQLFDIASVDKKYWEVLTATNDQTHGTVGLAREDLAVTASTTGTGGIYLTSAGGVVVNGSTVGTYTGWTDGALLAFWVDAGKLYYSVNGTAANSGNPVATGLTGIWCPAVGRASSTAVTCTYTMNFGQRPFAYTPPTGFKALCTANLPAVAIAKPSDHHQVKLDTGANIKGVMDALFSGNLLEWIKDRGNVNNHQLADIGRGLTAILQSNTTAAETTYSAPSGSSVGWGWKAGGTPVTNNAGSISSQVSANVAAGFSVVTYTGTGANATVGHGLGVAPKLVMVKRRTNSTTQGWAVWHTALAGTEYLALNSSNAKATAAGVWNSTTPSSTVISIGTDPWTNASGEDYVAYCFAEIPGYSKFGSYTGNGSADGPFVWCGFRPKFIMIKNASAVAGWAIYDAARDTYNVVQNLLSPNASDAESATAFCDVTATGFKVRVTNVFCNGNTNTIIFAAFAEHPFGGSNVSPAPAR